MTHETDILAMRARIAADLDRSAGGRRLPSAAPPQGRAAEEHRYARERLLFRDIDPLIQVPEI